MSFVKKNVVSALVISVFGMLIFFPKLREFIRRQLFMQDFMEKNNKEISLTDGEYRLKLKGINVPDADLESFKGEVLFLNFWGSWCPACIQEFPSIQQLYEAKGSKVSFVLVAMKDQEQSVRDFLLKNGYTVPVYFAQSLISEKLLPKRFPTTFIIGKNGRILKKDVGASDWNREFIRNFMDKVAE